MPTIKEVADKLSLSPQTIRRFVKQEFDIKPEPRKPIVLTDEQASIVANHFAGVANSVADVAQEKLPVAEPSAHVASEVATLKEEIATLNIEVATYKERVAGLERENELLREQLETTNKALEREQMQAKGFWSRLGQKLLPSANK